MNKATRILLAIGLILAVAAPAFAAEFKFNGQFNAKAYVQEKRAAVDDGLSEQWFDQRFRAKLTYSLNDNVSVVYYAEVDTPWGEESKGNIGDGGQVTYRTTGADAVNVETKNVYLDLKMGDTAATLGIQTIADAFEGVVAFEDMPGLKVSHKMGNTSLTAAYAKWDEDYAVTTTATTVTTEVETVDPGADVNTSTTTLSTAAKADSRGDWDDMDFYLVELKHKFSDSFTGGAGVYFIDDNRDSAANVTTGDSEIFFYGLNAAFTSGNFGVNGFAMLQDGEFDSTSTAPNTDYDYAAWMGTVKGTMKLENGDLGLRFIYFSEDDEADEQGKWMGFQGEYTFVNENQMQFMVDKFVANDGKEMYAIKDSVDKGYGLMAFIISGNHKLPSDVYLNWGAGYYMAADDTANTATNGTDAEVEKEDDVLGYELCARIGKKFFEKVDVSFNASWADYGDFYENAAGDTPDATYKTYLMVNVPF